MKKIIRGSKKLRITAFTLVALVLLSMAGGIHVANAASNGIMPASAGSQYNFELINNTDHVLVINGSDQIDAGESALIKASYVNAVSDDGLYEARTWTAVNTSNKVVNRTLTLSTTLLSSWKMSSDEYGNLLDSDGNIAKIKVSGAVRVLDVVVKSPDSSQADVTDIYAIADVIGKVNSAVQAFEDSASSERYMPSSWRYTMINQNGSSDIVEQLPSDESEAGNYVGVLVEPVFILTLEDGLGNSNVIEIVMGDSATLPSAADREGYCFLGWAADQSAVEASHLPDASYSPDGNESLYGIWKKLYTVIVDYNGSDQKTTSEVVKDGEKFTFPEAPEREGYTFLGWAGDKSAKEADYVSGDSLKVTSDETFYAIWRRLYTVTFNYNGSDQKEIISMVEDGDEITFPDANSRTGYTFLGWSKNVGAEAAAYLKDDTLKITADKTFYAVWKKNSYSLTLKDKTDKDLPYSVVSYPAIDVLYGEKISVDLVPQKAGYTFVKWNGPETMPAASATMEAEWKIASPVIDKAGTYYLVKGYSYTLGKSMKLSGDPNTYYEGTFFVPKDGTYTFE